MQQRCSTTEKEAFAVYQSVLKFRLVSKRAECTLCCNHKPLEAILSKVIKYLSLTGQSMELADYNITFIHIKGKSNVLMDAISRLKTLNIYKEPLENPKTPAVSNTQGYVMEVSVNDMHTISTTMLCTEQKWDIMYIKT